MKKNILLLMTILMSTNIAHSQEWFTSFDIAKKLAVVQNKMLFVMWEDALGNYYPVSINYYKENSVVINLADNVEANSMIWEYFVPVLLLESEFEELSEDIKKTRGTGYYDKLTDDSIKIMDINGNILNINTSVEFSYENLSEYINRYGITTTYIKHELVQYSKSKNATSSFLLASKYLDFAIFLDESVRPEIIELSNIYFTEAKTQLTDSELNSKLAYLQKLELLQIKGFLILNKPKKSRRALKNYKKEIVDKINLKLYAFLNYTTYSLLNNEENAAIWKSEVSLVDLKNAEIIIQNNITTIGKSN